MVTTALKTNADAFQLPVRLFPREIIWNNFPEAMAKIPYVRYMMNTIFITLLSVVGQMVATPLVAYSLAKIKWKALHHIRSDYGNDDDPLYGNHDPVI